MTRRSTLLGSAETNSSRFELPAKNTAAAADRWRALVLGSMLLLWADLHADLGSPGEAAGSGSAAQSQPDEGSQDPIGRWFSTKQRLLQKRGLAFGTSYNLLGQRLNGRQSDDAAGGVLDAAFSWTLIGRETDKSGTLVALVENQHRLGSRLAPEAAGILAGSVLPTASFASFGWHLNNLHWSQQLAGDSAIVVVGIVDTVDYVDFWGFNDPLTAFSNFAFAGSPAIPLPDPGFGVMFRLATDDVYVSGGVADGKSVAGRLDPVDFFTGEAYFSHLEIGTTPSLEPRLVENFHVTFWHQNNREEPDAPEGWGATLSLTMRVSERLLPFLRAGYSSGDAALLERSVTIGTGYRLRSSDLLGVGLNLGRPSISSRNQTTSELFYRLQLGRLTTLTPHLQVIRNPALDPDLEWLTALGLRVRFVL